MGLIGTIWVAVRRERIAAVERTVRRREHERRLRALQDGVEHVEEQQRERGKIVHDLELLLLEVAEVYATLIGAGNTILNAWPAGVPMRAQAIDHIEGVKLKLSAAFSSEREHRRRLDDPLLSAINRTAGLAIDCANADAAFVARLRALPAQAA
jgi:hypothetical protein